MYLRHRTNLYFDARNTNFYNYACCSHVGPLPSIKFLSLDMCNLDQVSSLPLRVESRCVELKPGISNLYVLLKKHFETLLL